MIPSGTFGSVQVYLGDGGLLTVLCPSRVLLPALEPSSQSSNTDV